MLGNGWVNSSDLIAAIIFCKCDIVTTNSERNINLLVPTPITMTNETEQQGQQGNEGNSIVVYWTSRDADVARELVFPYVLNSKLRGWWGDVTLVVWGPSQLTLCETEDLREHIELIVESNVKVEACKACSDHYGVSRKLADLGIEVKYMGILTTEYLKSGRKILTF